MSKGQKIPEPKEGIPAWIISFTDMVTLLLAFFVLLQAFAHEQHPELFHEGQGSFKNAISGLGLPRWLYGIETKSKRDFLIRRHDAEPEEQEEEQLKEKPDVIDAEEERIQRAFQMLKKNMESTSKDLTLKTIRVIATPIKFSSGSASLNKDTKEYLNSVAVALRDNLPPGSTAVYIIGMAPDEKASQRCWVLSAQRANAIQNYLQAQSHGIKTKWTLHSWGGGLQYGRFPKGTETGIVVMGANDGG